MSENEKSRTFSFSFSNPPPAPPADPSSPGFIHPQTKKPFFHSVSTLFQSKSRKLPCGTKQLRVKPYLHTEWMTEEELQNDAENASQFTVDLTNVPPSDVTNPPLPTMGTLAVELIEMSGVIKADLLGKSDPYAVFVLEEHAIKTDYIEQCLSPIYPSLCRRSAKFPIKQACSTLYVGAFDYDGDANPLDDDDPLGRIAIKLSAIRPNTEYDVTYPFQHSELTALKGERGFIRLRYYLDWNHNDRQVLLSYLKHPQSFIVATDDRKLWSSALYCIHGKHIGDEYNWKIFMSYVHELKSIASLLHKPLITFATDVILWRAYLKSAFLFAATQFLVVRPTYIPGFIVGCILLVMCDCYLTQSLRRPKLHRVTPLSDIFMTLLGGGVFWKFCGIEAEPEENHPFISAEDQLAALEHNMEEDDDEEDADAAPESPSKATTKTEKKPAVTKTHSLFSLGTMNPMSLVLGPLQKVLKELCMQLRTFNNLFSWKDPFVSFWTTLVVFVVWIVVTVFPYAFFFFWLFRIISFVLFGPQNFFIGLYLERKKKAERARKMSTKAEKFRMLELGCSCCKEEFSWINRKHHCRNCGEAVCGDCSQRQMKVTVAMFGTAKGKTTPKKKKKVCDKCFRGERVVNPEKARAMLEESAKDAEEDDENMFMGGVRNLGKGFETMGRGVVKGTEMIGKGVVDGTVAVGGGVMDGTVAVGKGTGSAFKLAGRSIIKLAKGKYTLENVVERSMNRKFVDRPSIKVSCAKKITEKERLEKKEREREEICKRAKELAAKKKLKQK